MSTEAISSALRLELREVTVAELRALPYLPAVALGMSPRAVYRLAARYRVSAQTTSLLPRRRGPNKKRRRLGDIREQVIEETIERRYLERPRTPMEEVYRNVTQRCRDLPS